MNQKLLFICLCFLVYSCGDNDSDESNNVVDGECNEIIAVDSLRGDCSETLSSSNQFSITTSGDLRKITANNILALSSTEYADLTDKDPNTIYVVT